MTTEATGDEATIAQRPRLVSRLRLVPLAVLCLMVATAAVVGVTRGTPVTIGIPASALPKDPAVRAAEKAAERAVKAKSKCVPAFSTGISTEPWAGAAKAKSEKAFSKHIKKENPAYVNGRDGWKFFTDYQSENFSQAIGRVTQSARQREAWAKWIAKQEKIVKQAGGDYHVIVAPANWDIYPQKLPTWAQQLRGTTSLRKLMKAHPELPWIDPSAALRQAARKHNTYEPLDSHWTPYGGYVAWQAITKCLRATNPAFKPLGSPAISGVGIMANSNEFAANGVPSGKPRRTYPIYAQPHPTTTTTHEPDGAGIATSPDFVTDTVQAPLKTSTPGAQAPGLTVLTLRDSTGNALSPLYSSSFGTTIQYGHGIGQVGLTPPNLAQLMATYHPQVVLFVITERFLSEKAPR
jgi:SGNH hydrolase-like domain, acetyltransferase AlgX